MSSRIQKQYTHIYTACLTHPAQSAFLSFSTFSFVFGGRAAVAAEDEDEAQRANLTKQQPQQHHEHQYSHTHTHAHRAKSKRKRESAPSLSIQNLGWCRAGEQNATVWQGCRACRNNSNKKIELNT